MVLTDIPMTDTVIKGTTVKRRLLVTRCVIAGLDFGAGRLLMQVPVLNYTEQSLSSEVEVFDAQTGETTSTPQTSTVEVPYQSGLYKGTGGIELYAMNVSNEPLYRVDARTGAPAQPNGENDVFLMGEFDFIRAALQSGGITLETLIMQYMSRIVAGGKLDNDTYSVLR